MSAEKLEFLKSRFVGILKQIPTDTHPVWGKMTVQQMIEHFSDSVRVSAGKIDGIKTLTPQENLPKMQEFLMGDKPFRENTPNPLLPEIPAPVRNPSIDAALQELQKEIDKFISVFEANDHLTTTNPFFGELNFEMNIQLLYKHALHHLRQFGVTVN